LAEKSAVAYYTKVLFTNEKSVIEHAPELNCQNKFEKTCVAKFKIKKNFFTLLTLASSLIAPDVMSWDCYKVLRVIAADIFLDFNFKKGSFLNLIFSKNA
jgi:hypothetical protein